MKEGLIKVKAGDFVLELSKEDYDSFFQTRLKVN